MKQVYVEFKKNGKQYIFFDNNLNIKIDDNVIVDTERGLQFGRVVNIIDEKTNEKHSMVIKIADEKDKKQFENNNLLSIEALEKARELSSKLGLNMNFIDCYFTFDKKQLVFHFLADNRIDFRELAKSLASIYKTRIELRQVGVRDKAKVVSGVGPCGLKLCCSCFLNDLDAVSISMVKNQNLSLNPSKINGLCGRLLCCLKYEDQYYTECKKMMPSVGGQVKEKDGFSGKVTSIDILKNTYVVTSEDGESKEYFVESCCGKCDKRCKN